MREGTNVGFLHDVLGLAVVAQDAAGDPVELAIVRLHDGANRAFVTRAGAANQFQIVIAGAGDQPGLNLLHVPHSRSQDTSCSREGCGKVGQVPKHGQINHKSAVRRINPPARIPQKWIPVLRSEYAQLLIGSIFFTLTGFPLSRKMLRKCSASATLHFNLDLRDHGHLDKMPISPEATDLGIAQRSLQIRDRHRGRR